ncbi:hypothetical protein [Azospirillum sp. SYSU D00513]|uniref:hypothetical protein n=1 Tax=Azospirillum sp. SYSU D00513 TaxID=2812561 RepID=UPI001A97AC34|nr:hypothetical protein [Azospirillum sp. SYSU D00513]
MSKVLARQAVESGIEHRADNVVGPEVMQLARARRAYKSSMEQYTDSLSRLEEQVSGIGDRLASCRGMLDGYMNVCQDTLDFHAACQDAMEQDSLEEMIRLRDILARLVPSQRPA